MDTKVTYELAASLIDEVGRENPGLVDQFPLRDGMESFSSLSAYADYGEVPEDLYSIMVGLSARFGENSLMLYNKALLASFIRRFCCTRSLEGYPASIATLYSQYLTRVAEDMFVNPDDYYKWDNDLFRKDLAVSRRKLVPCGAQVVDVSSGIGRRALVTGGITQAARFFRFLTEHLKRRAPLYQMHMSRRLMLEFNPEGWKKCYKRIAELIACHPDIRGVFGASWWFDPNLKRVSPRIAFLHDLPVQSGAAVFCLGREAEATPLAIANSKERQTAFDQGLYRPRTYLLVWPREALLSWARNDGSQR